MGGKGREGERGPKRGQAVRGDGRNQVCHEGEEGTQRGSAVRAGGKIGESVPQRGQALQERGGGRTSLLEQRSNGKIFGRKTSKKATGWDEDL